jgi:hypothetical protein
MLDCCNPARIASDLSSSLCFSQHVLPSCTMDLYFIDLCKLGCILRVMHNYLDHIYVFSIYQSSATEAWYKPILFSNVLAWFDRAHNTFDHKASVRALALILQNKIVYIFAPRCAHDYMHSLITCNLCCLMYSTHIIHVNNNNTPCYVYIYSPYTLFFLFLPRSAYPKPRTAFLEEREDD